MAQVFDLFGLPIPESKGKRGRPPHEVTEETTSKVNMLLAFGRTDDEIAAALGVSGPTFRKYYFWVDERRANARLHAEGWLLQRLAAQVDDGNVAAMKEMSRRFDKHDLAQVSAAIQARGSRPEKDKEEKLGKKEQARKDATGVAGKYAPPSAPRTVN